MKKGIKKAMKNLLNLPCEFQVINDANINKLIGVSLRNQLEFEDKIPKIPEILKSQKFAKIAF